MWYKVTVYVHNCIKTLQAKSLIEKVQINTVKHLSQYPSEENESIVLPSLKIYTTPVKLLFGRKIDIPMVEPEYLPAHPTNIRRGYDEVD